MPTEIDYAWMAAAAYNENRNRSNRIQLPLAWARLDQLAIANDASGFAAEVFKHSNAEVVISYRGTD